MTVLLFLELFLFQVVFSIYYEPRPTIPSSQWKDHFIYEHHERPTSQLFDYHRDSEYYHSKKWHSRSSYQHFNLHYQHHSDYKDPKTDNNEREHYIEFSGNKPGIAHSKDYCNIPKNGYPKDGDEDGNRCVTSQLKGQKHSSSYNEQSQSSKKGCNEQVYQCKGDHQLNRERFCSRSNLKCKPQIKTIKDNDIISSKVDHKITSKTKPVRKTLDYKASNNKCKSERRPNQPFSESIPNTETDSDTSNIIISTKTDRITSKTILSSQADSNTSKNILSSQTDHDTAETISSSQTDSVTLENRLSSSEMDIGASETIPSSQTDGDTPENVLSSQTDHDTPETISSGKTDSDILENILSSQTDGDIPENILRSQIDSDTLENILSSQTDGDTPENILSSQTDNDTSETISSSQTDSDTFKNILSSSEMDIGASETIPSIQTDSDTLLSSQTDRDTSETISSGRIDSDTSENKSNSDEIDSDTADMHRETERNDITSIDPSSVTQTTFLVKESLPLSHSPSSTASPPPSPSIKHRQLHLDYENKTSSSQCNEDLKATLQMLLFKMGHVIENQTQLCQQVYTLSNNISAVRYLLKGIKCIEKLLERTQHYSVLSPAPLPTSCNEIKQWHPRSRSGFYEMLLPSHTKGIVYCNMEDLCNSSNGWMKIGYLNMSDGLSKCPNGFRMYTENKTNVCGRHFSVFGSCNSVSLPTLKMPYSEICGRVYGYQWYSTNAVWQNSRDKTRDNLDTPYVDGVSITYGSPRKHIWTFMAGERQDLLKNTHYSCPCAVGSRELPQGFIGNDYFCESGCSGDPKPKLYTNDILWDGKQCEMTEQACCQTPGLPWFHKILNHPTQDDVELRICADSSTYSKDIGVTLYEIYIK